MFEQGVTYQTVPAVAAALRKRAAVASAVQSELARKVGEINQHWLERMQKDSTDVWQLLFRCGGTPAVGEKIKLCEEWLEGAMKKAADDATYALDSARALGELEMRFFAANDEMPVTAVKNGAASEDL